jgi:hypothetical protein
MDNSLLLHSRRWQWRDRADWQGLVAVFGLATGLAVLAMALGWRGSDLPAQVFRAELFREDGFVLWNSQWFGGHATLAYSVISPVLSSLTGPVMLGAIGGVVSAVLFERILRVGFGRSSLFGALWFASSTVTNLVVGRVTFAVGVAFGLGAVLALQRKHVVIAAACALLCSLASPLAGVFLAVGAAACAIANPPRRLTALVTAAAALAPIAAITLLFRSPGSEPYEPWALGWDLALCAGVFLFVPKHYSVIRSGAALFGMLAVFAFVIPSPLGGNVSRFDQYIAGPVLVCALLPRRRALVALITLPVLVWQWFPAVDGIAFAQHDPSTKRAYYAPLLAYLRTQPPSLGRVEIPPTYRHWEAAYAAPTIALARGWERQLDIGYNPIFYGGQLTAATYRTWLSANAVQYVALPDARLDDSSLAERAIIERGTPYLRELWHSAHWTVWRFTGYHGLVEGPGIMTDLSPDRFVLDVSSPGTLLVRVRASSHWAVRGEGCVDASDDGWTQVHADTPGTLEVVQAFRGTPCSG